MGPESNIPNAGQNDSRAADSVPSMKRLWIQPLFVHFFTSPERVKLLVTIWIALFLLAVYLYGLLGDKVFPGEEVFSVFFLAFLAFLGGKLVSLAMMPELIGQMLVGFAYRNAGVVPYYEDISNSTSSAIRQCVLAIILLRAGLGLEPAKLLRSKLLVAKLTIIPCAAEVITMAIVSHFLLELSWLFAFMLGFIVSAVSVEVVLSLLLNLEKEGYGTDKGICGIVIAAASLDDVAAIAGFMLLFSIAFSTSNLAWTIIKAPLEPVVGVFFAFVMGVVIWKFPPPALKTPYRVYYNVVLLGLFSMDILLVSGSLNVHGIGPIACISVGFVTAYKWSSDNLEQPHDGVNETLGFIWDLVQPFMFGLIGTEVSWDIIKDSGAWSVLSIILALFCRACVTYLIFYGAGFNWKEKLFICSSWLPKATVQAAIGAHAIDYAKRHNAEDKFLHQGMLILNVSVLSIVLTAPISAAIISIAGRKLLTKAELSDEDFLDE